MPWSRRGEEETGDVVFYTDIIPHMMCQLTTSQVLIRSLLKDILVISFWNSLYVISSHFIPVTCDGT